MPAKRANIEFAFGKHIEFPARETYRLKDKARTATLFIYHLLRVFPPGGTAALSPQVRLIFRKAKNDVWPEIKNCFRKTADMCRRFARSWFCGEQNHGRKEVNQKAMPFERGKTLQSETKKTETEVNFGLRKEFSGFVARSRTTVVPSSPAKIP